MKPILTALLILVTGTSWAQESPAKRIAPYLTDTAVAVIRIDVGSLDSEAAEKIVEPLLGTMSSNAGQQLAAGFKKIQEAGFQEYYFVFDVAELQNDAGYAVMPIPDDVEPPELGNAKNAAIIGNALVGGSPAIIEHFKSEPQAEKRPDLAAAFESVAESPIQMVVAPNADQRRILREMLPDLSREYGDITGEELAAGVKWAAVGVSFAPKLDINAIIQADSEQAAEKLAQVISNELRIAAARKEVLEILPMAPLMVGALIPKPEGNRLIIAPDDLLGPLSTSLTALLGAARTDASRSQTQDRLKQFGLAMHNFHSVYNSFPPSASYGANGKPLLSWRVFALPFLDESNLYKEFHLDERWDGPHNKQLIEKMPDVFKSPSTPTKPGKTVFQVPDGKGLLFDGKEGIPISKITDGTSNTIMIVETTADAAVTWTKPDDLDVDPERPLKGLAGDRNGFWTTWADGSTRFVPSAVNAEMLYKAFTRAGGEVIEEFWER